MSAGNQSVGPLSRACFHTLLALMLLAPLFRSGKVPLAVMALELLALLGLALVLWQGPRGVQLRRVEWTMIAALLLVPLLQLVPIPGLSRLSLPGQADYYTALQLVGDSSWTTLSILPRETWLGWLVLLLPVAVFLLARSATQKQLRTGIALVLAMAAAQALLGLLQYGVGPGSPFMIGMDESGGLSKGTWRGRNSYANFLDMALMISLALFMATLGQHKRDHREQTLRQRLVYWSTLQGHQAFLYGALSVLLLLGVIFSRSRTGIGLSIVGILLAATVFSRRIGGENVYGLAGTVASIVVACGIAIGLGPVWERFSQTDPMSEGRWTIFAHVREGIAQFFPLGAGSGTFEQVFPAFHALSMSSVTMNQAHNSYLEWLFNAGIFGALLILAGLALFVVRWVTVWKKGAWGEFRYIQVGAGLGMVLTLMHEMVDFNLFVPANLVYFAFLAGVFFYPYEEPAAAPRKKRESSVADVQRSRQLLQPVASEQAHNPFMDD
ncbi:O-antigen ligase domain-containing protein [Halioglobus maricola]|uniref:O-antigen ligase domain-containing protein n=1 Tax=Halioglobus maricola TaxID=2601894 RepID=A0A5P9NGF5_9GAMM|nr:O-antigen ligase family protein [Halioglobus maricola]QFU74629.1 O-antigen ligase domain-containing protein [Halioglobus maricola]